MLLSSTLPHVSEFVIQLQKLEEQTLKRITNLPVFYSFLFSCFITYHIQKLPCRTDEPLILQSVAIFLVYCNSSGYWITGIHSDFYSWCLQIYILQCKM